MKTNDDALTRVGRLGLLDLGDLPRPASKPFEPTLGHRERVALVKMGNPDGDFRFYEWRCIGPDVLVAGCVVTRTYTKGKKKGTPVYDGPRLEAVVTDAEVSAERARFEQETGKCGECCGDGQVFKGWHYQTGASYRPCRVCAGTGLLVVAVDPQDGIGTERPRATTDLFSVADGPSQEQG
jgi:hypothetical protein